MKAYTDVIREVGEEGEAPITIRPSPDFPEMCIEILTASEKAKEYWGNFSFSVNKETAIHLGNAILAAAKELP